MEATIICQGITMEQLLSKFESIIDIKMKEAISLLKPSNDYKYWNVDEVSKFLQISKVTLHKWNKLGYLTPHRIGRRLLYRSDEIEGALKKRKFTRN